MQNSNPYANIFIKILNEDSISGAGGVFGDSQQLYSPNGGIQSSDTFAPGDSRNIYNNKKPVIQRRPGIKKNKKKLKKRS